MELNRGALVRSLESLLDEGNENLQLSELREYVVLYNDTLKYISNHLQESEVLKELYPRFPKIEWQEFNTPANKARSYMGYLLSLMARGRYSLGFKSAQDYDPGLQQYYTMVCDKIPLINTLASEMIMRIGE